MPRSPDLSRGFYQKLPPQEPPDYTELARKAREASPSERLEAATAYLRSRYARLMDPNMWAVILYEGYLRRQDDDHDARDRL